MASSSLQQQIASMRQSLFDEGIIDRDRFIQLETMTNPDFVNIVIEAYFKDSPKAINDIENALEANPLNVTELDRCLHIFKDGNDCIGASKVITEINNIKFFCYDKDMERSKSRAALVTMQQEYIILKSKLEAYLALLRQAALAPVSMSNTNPPGQGSANGND
ncbi:pseudo histidine-containing phosphotransfer protein 2-like [Quercus lobata]|uniref:Histidine-containing phosphotransfer protein n=1 Tax=Quercus lobata TaxID=97700 RepID=A0A7N2L9U1_QUELO|nr:pseudo histidine-containing phosphotransfer protein 2-like [Quercus lobata]